MYFSLQVTENSTIVYLKSKISPASRLSFAEVICQLENETTLENIWKETAHKEAYIARGYSISITNDGVHFGESDSMLIYNSSCVNCTKAGNQILCDKNVSMPI